MLGKLPSIFHPEEEATGHLCSLPFHWLMTTLRVLSPSLPDFTFAQDDQVQATSKKHGRTRSHSDHCNGELSLSSEEGHKGQVPTLGCRKLCYQREASDGLQVKQVPSDSHVG